MVKWSYALSVPISAVCVLVAACGSKPQPSTPNPEVATDAGAADAEPAPTNPALEAQRPTFIENCTAKSGSAPYCECAWGEFKDVFKDTDLSAAPPPNDPKLATLVTRTKEKCASKVTDEELQAHFNKVCIGEERGKSGYCDCAWKSLRKALPREDFITDDPSRSPAFAKERQAMAKECRGTLPVAVVYGEFMKGCGAATDPTKRKLCTCLWKKIRAKLKPEQVASASRDDLRSIPGLKECKP